MLTNAIREDHNNSDGVALCIGITLDDTIVYSGKRSMTPVYMFILNAIDESFEMILLGFAPSDKLPYSDNDIYKKLNETFKSRKGKKGVIAEIIKSNKWQLQINYLYDIISPILATQSNGTLLRVGSFNDLKLKLLYIYV